MRTAGSMAATMFLALAADASAQPQTAPSTGWGSDPPALSSLVAFAQTESDLRVAVLRYKEDEAAIGRRYPVLFSPTRAARFRQFYEGWRAQLNVVEFERLNPEGRVDYVMLRNRIAYDLEMLRLSETRAQEIAPLVPFSDDIRALQERRLDRRRAEPRASADILNRLATQVRALTTALNREGARADGLVRRRGVTPVIAMRAADQTLHLRDTLEDWNTFYAGYDPTFAWWTSEPYGRLRTALEDYSRAILKHMVGVVEGETPPIVGDPVLTAGLQADLANEMISYSLPELIRIGEQEFAWIREQMLIVSRRMGYGDDWRAALEHTKNLAPPPGEAPWAIFDIASYEEGYIERQGSITMPPLSREIWRLAMQTPERQLINPFFSGGEVTRLSYPHVDMEHEDKLMSLRGNTPHFNFPTVQHELVPGHHMQGFMNMRFNPHRARLSRTPVWAEGWAVYWEMRLWDDPTFARNDPDRMGMLFWRLHRAARIVFSLNYRLGRWSPQQCVDYLVNEVGHERANAEAEVRRTARDAPFYQAAYMVGALQFRALHQELVASGRMTDMDFHDAVMQGGPMPVELVRARLTGQALTRDYRAQWRFYNSIRR